MWCKVLSHTHTYSGRNDHGGTEQPPGSYANLAAWCQRCGIDALGMGSPYTLQSASSYVRFDGDERDAYYRPDFDKQSLVEGGDVAGMLRQVNHVAQGRTLFYLDNETPKGRFGHMWWVGYRRDMPEWHDYDQPFDQWMLEQSQPGDPCDEPMDYERRPYLQILAIQRSRGALGFWAHPTSWWRGDRQQFVTNIATEMPVHAIAEGGLDGLVVMGYHPFRPQYQDLWFEMLDRGYRIPAVAEMDAGLSHAPLWNCTSPMLTHVYQDDESIISVDGLCEGFRSGRMFASTGPFVELIVDGCHMGQATRTSARDAHDVRITAHPTPGCDRLARVELVGPGGKVVWHRDGFVGGTLKLRIPGLGGRGYLVARVFQDVCEHWRDVRAFAVSNPVYLHPAGTSFEAASTTTVRMRIHSRSPLIGAELRFESTDGELLSTTIARAGEMVEIMPANGRVTVVDTQGRCRTEYLVNANKKLIDVQRYLYRGRFLVDFPLLCPGEVPPQAWRIDRYVEAMREMTLDW
jgi:hypothetical protein